MKDAKNFNEWGVQKHAMPAYADTVDTYGGFRLKCCFLNGTYCI